MELERFLESQEGYQFKQKLMLQIQRDQKRKAKDHNRELSDLDESIDSLNYTPKKRSKRSYTIDSCDHPLTGEDINNTSNEIELSSTPDYESNAADKKSHLLSLQNKLLDLQKDVDKLPNAIARMNAEMAMMSNSLPSAVSNNDFVIWTFELPIKWKDESFSVPIMEPNHIATLNEALQDEFISIDVVIFGRSIIYYIRNLHFKHVTFIFQYNTVQLHQGVFWNQQNKEYVIGSAHIIQINYSREMFSQIVMETSIRKKWRAKNNNSNYGEYSKGAFGGTSVYG